MTGPISFIAIGALLLVVLFLFLRRAVASHGKIEPLSDVHESLNTLQSELLPDWFVDRLFSKEDQEFASNQECPNVARLLDRERTAIALSWLKETREHVARLMDFYLRLARQRPDLRPSVEVKLTIEYLQFQAVCRLLAVLMRMLGPIRVRSLTGYAVNVATHLGAVSEKVLTALDDAFPGTAEET